MSAHLYFDVDDVPIAVAETAVRRTDPLSERVLVSFPGCPVSGIELGDGQIDLPFPRAESVRGWMINWLMYWGIPFRVLP